jgi:hypothetical protein
MQSTFSTASERSFSESKAEWAGHVTVNVSSPLNESLKKRPRGAIQIKARAWILSWHQLRSQERSKKSDPVWQTDRRSLIRL